MPDSMIQYLSKDGILIKEPEIKPSNEILVRAYETMLLTRLFDERMLVLQRQGLISFALSSLGEEACAVGSAAALSIDDWLYPQYREAGLLFWRGFKVMDFVHHMFCNSKDLILGRQMPNHFGCRKLNVVTVSSPIGTKIPHAAGSAYAMKYLKDPAVSVCYFGEGATSEGDFHAGVNFAAVRKVPAIFFCRNNGYAISTPAKEQFASDGILPKGIGYGILASRMDGNDFFAVYETVYKAKQACLKNKGPILLEAMTYRLGAHSTSDDPTRYRSDEEVKDKWTFCPLRRMKLYLESQKLWNDEKEKQSRENFLAQINEAVKEAKNAPPPPLESLFENVYFEVPKHLKRQLNELKRLNKEEPHGGA